MYAPNSAATGPAFGYSPPSIWRTLPFKGITAFSMDLVHWERKKPLNTSGAYYFTLVLENTAEQCYIGHLWEVSQKGKVVRIQSWYRISYQRALQDYDRLAA